LQQFQIGDIGTVSTEVVAALRMGDIVLIPQASSNALPSLLSQIHTTIDHLLSDKPLKCVDEFGTPCSAFKGVFTVLIRLPCFTI
jgi:hypothetical protein